MARKPLVAVLAALLLIGVGVLPAFAQAVTFTDTGHFVIVPLDDPDNPCQPAVGEGLVNFVEHFTLAANGSEHFTFTETGTFEIIDPADSVVAEGRFTVWAGGNSNPNGSVFTLTLRAKGEFEDGTPVQFNLVVHEQDGSEFVQFNCHDGTGVHRVSF